MTSIKSLMLVLIGVFCLSAFANEKVPDSVKKIVNSLQEWGKDPALVKFVKKHNEQSLTLTKIKDRDEAWKKTTGVDKFMKAMMDNKAAKRMLNLEKTKPYYFELFLMGNKGENVAMTNKTSDYWQGDEAKFQKSYDNGKGAVHIGEVEFDESAQAYLVQISVPVIDNEKAIGAMTVGINIDEMK